MSPFGLDATGLMIWGLVAHLVADWPLQNAWMANNKSGRRSHRLKPDQREALAQGYFVARRLRWWDRHPAAYVHAGIHGVLLALVFGWVAAPLALAHLVIDTRVPVARWSRLVRQTQPTGHTALVGDSVNPNAPYLMEFDAVALHTRVEGDELGNLRKDFEALKKDLRARQTPLYDVGTEVRFWTDQVFHVATIAAAALLVAAA